MAKAKSGRVIEFNPGEETKCKRCGAEIVWLTSARTKGRYPVNFNGGFPVVTTNDFHKCQRK